MNAYLRVIYVLFHSFVLPSKVSVCHKESGILTTSPRLSKVNQAFCVPDNIPHNLVI